jgi:hypothetical protein
MVRIGVRTRSGVHSVTHIVLYSTAVPIGTIETERESFFYLESIYSNLGRRGTMYICRHEKEWERSCKTKGGNDPTCQSKTDKLSNYLN